MAADFVQKLQALNAKNSEHELSIEKYLIKSEEAFFGKVRKERLSTAASIRSSRRDSIWGTPTPSIYSVPGCKFCVVARVLPTDVSAIAPNMQSEVSLMSPNPQAVFSPANYEGPLHHEGPSPEVVPMTGLQIALSREIKGWPLYTIIIALGQVGSFLHANSHE